MRRYMRLIVSAMLILSLMVSLAGCGNKNKEIAFEPEVSSIYVCDNGTVLGATVEDFSESYYDIDELKSFVEEQVISFNEAAGAAAYAYDTEESEEDDNLPVSIKDCYTTNEGKAVLILECSDYDDFYTINNLAEYDNVISSVEVTTISEMKGSDETFDVDELFKADGSNANMKKVLKKNKYHVVKTSGTGTVAVQGIIKYVSADVVVNEDATAATVNGDVCYIIYK